MDFKQEEKHPYRKFPPNKKQSENWQYISYGDTRMVSNFLLVNRGFRA